ncbi:glycoside hydrolase family 2 TIM barrel-domain containing protein [Mitsuokella sp. oral taxon 131]|uniref:glycoside hydrolase family 2 TIM barrel-domain containing protein n=1 Tax=Mitsuokella sp. oral taxon 131 TaxID=1321780 RepID=UPI0003AE6C14|nr:glycoside hydrolase family 2 TIM barrel-domain containing protein [Mitsuokella sp. oral taxon 131]ERL25141.1 Beta galactosidase small chain [Mitsuokella sp. oral taxon 131 str. W9106]
MNVSDFEKLADPRYFEENRLPAHSDHIVYRTEEELAAGRSSCYRSMDGLWHFAYAPNLARVPMDFMEAAYDCHDWETIRVPAHIQMEGYGYPHYTNTTYPWDGHECVKQGEIPKRENPVGCYVKYFEAPADWKQVFISFQGVDCALSLWLNGHFVGYSEDSCTPADFDLTPYLTAGENKLAAMVVRFASGSWLEDQDFWRFSGIFRPVVLYTKPAAHIEDIFVHASPINNYRDGSLAVDCKLLGMAAQVDLTLYDENGEQVLALCRDAKDGTCTLSGTLNGAKLWSAEHPHLYRALIRVKDTAGNVQEVTTQNIGFREFKIDETLMKINGKRIVFKGVNRHEFDCYNGRAMNPALFEQDIREMKRNNINALRMSHYPNSSYIYDLADRYGLYVIDETNLETHGSWMRNGVCKRDENTVPNDNPAWLDAVLARAEAMLERDKNHASILMWSCGNESCGGRDLCEMHAYFRRRDPSRLVHYESIFWDRRYNATSDMESQMYTKVADIKKFLAVHRDKPFICCEYTHSMGNSNGGMHQYTRLAEEDALYQGGFIWDFVDQAIWRRDRYGKEMLCYGGDFGDRPSDYSFSGNGIFFSDRRPTTKLQEVKFNYQNFAITPAWDYVKIENKSLFADAAEYTLRLSLLRDGRAVWKSEQDAPHIAAGKSDEIEICVPHYGTGEYVLTASLCLSDNTLWAERGYEIAFGQTVLPERAASPELSPAAAWLSRHTGYEAAVPLVKARRLRVVVSDINLGVQGEGFSLMFSSAQGNLVSYRYGGQELIEEMPQPLFWRAPIDNDYGSRRMADCAQWKLASLYKKCERIAFAVDGAPFEMGSPYFGQNGQRETEAETVAVRFFYRLATNPAAACTVMWEVHEDGAIKATLDYKKVEGLSDMPDFALLFTLPADYDRIRYYGLGAADNYIDRMEGGRLGIYEQSLADGVEPYLRPQESGNHGGIRWFEARDRRGRGIRVYAGAGTVPFEASASPYSPHELETARHPHDLPVVHHTYLRASAGMCGVGGDDTWGAPVLEEYTHKNEDRRFAFWMKGI